MNIKHTLTLALALTLLTTAAFPQTKPPRTTPLKTVPVKVSAKATLDLEAGLIFNSGDVKPVGRATFYLLKENPEKVILTQEHLDTYNKELADVLKQLGGGLEGLTYDTLDKWSLESAADGLHGDLTPNFAVILKKDIEAASTEKTITGFDGKATFTSIPVGDYYIFGIYKVGKQSTYWSVPVSVKPDTNKVILDNENMKG